MQMNSVRNGRILHFKRDGINLAIFYTSEHALRASRVKYRQFRDKIIAIINIFDRFKLPCMTDIPNKKKTWLKTARGRSSFFRTFFVYSFEE